MPEPAIQFVRPGNARVCLQLSSQAIDVTRLVTSA